MSIKYRILIFLALFLGIWIYWRLHKHDRHVDDILASHILPVDDQEKLIFDPHQHVITVVTHTDHGDVVKKQYLNPRGTTDVEETKKGEIHITNRPAGTEINARFGTAYGSDLVVRAALGLDLFYWHGLDAGTAIFIGPSFKSTRCGGYVVYNVYNNFSVGPYLDNHHDFGGFVSIRF